MKISLNYKITDLTERQKIVEEICEKYSDRLTEANLEVLSNYILNALEKKERKERNILTDNRMATVNKRETSFEGIVSKLENGEDGIYSLVREDKNMILSPAISITKQDLQNLPFLHQIKEAIAFFKGFTEKNYIIQSAIIDLSQTQYLVKSAYLKPLKFNIFSLSTPPEKDWSEWVNLGDEKHVAALLKYYPKLKTDMWDRLDNDLRWILIDLENMIEAHIRDQYPDLYNLLIYRLDGLENKEVQEKLYDDFGKTYSTEYISTLFNKRIPKYIAEAAQKEELELHYIFQEKGIYKKCNRCGQIKLKHNAFFSINKSSKDNFYSICKECRNKKKKGD